MTVAALRKYNIQDTASFQTMNRMTQVHMAVILGNVELVEQALVKWKKVINAQDINGWTALHHAVALGKKKVVQLLEAQGALADIKCRLGMTVRKMRELCSHSVPLNTPLVLKPDGSLYTAGEYAQATGTGYLNELKVKSSRFIREWGMTLPSTYPGSTLVYKGWESFQIRRQANPLKMVKTDQRISILAEATYAKGDLIGEILGKVKENGNYSFRNYSNEFAHLEQGFPNTMVISVTPWKARPLRAYCLAIEPIPSGTPLYKGYDPEKKPLSPYLEARPHELEVFLKSLTIDFIRETPEDAIEAYGKQTKLNYVASRPAIYFLGLLKGWLEVDVVRWLYSQLSFSSEEIQELIPLAVMSFVRIKRQGGEEAIAFLNLIEEAIKSHPFQKALAITKEHLLSYFKWTSLPKIVYTSPYTGIYGIGHILSVKDLQGSFFRVQPYQTSCWAGHIADLTKEKVLNHQGHTLEIFTHNGFALSKTPVHKELKGARDFTPFDKAWNDGGWIRKETLLQFLEDFPDLSVFHLH